MEHRPDNPYEQPASTNDEVQFPRSASSAASSGTGASVASSYGSGHSGTADTADTAHDMVGRVAQGAHATIDKIADRATPHVQRLQEGYHQTEELMHRNAEHAREKAHQWTDSMRGSVREHPLTAVATAFAAGLLFARLTR